jgi:hypothetical protein
MSRPGASPWHYQGDIMKKTPKKLELAKETLRMLEKSEIRAVVGASNVAECTEKTCKACLPSCDDIC